MSDRGPDGGSARRPMVAGNWKLNGSVASNETLLAGIRAGLDGHPALAVDMLVCPPYPYLGLIHAVMKAKGLDQLGLELGAQSVATVQEGAYTGEVAAAMVRDVGCEWSIVGHSERRSLYGESDEVVAEKTRRVLESGLGVIVCVGETLDQREANETESVLGAQLDAVSPVLAMAPQPSRVVVAYEPVWAIGTGKTASPEMAQQAHAFIRERLKGNKLSFADDVRLLYGGSVKPDNAAGLFAQPDIDGGLIGGASLVAEDFLAICRAASALTE